MIDINYAGEESGDYIISLDIQSLCMDISQNIEHEMDRSLPAIRECLIAFSDLVINDDFVLSTVIKSGGYRTKSYSSLLETVLTLGQVVSLKYEDINDFKTRLKAFAGLIKKKKQLLTDRRQHYFGLGWSTTFFLLMSFFVWKTYPDLKTIDYIWYVLGIVWVAVEGISLKKIITLLKDIDKVYLPQH